jgi:hypothetical protein
MVNTRHKYCDDCRDTAAPWRLDEEAVLRACKLLGITKPVEIRRTSGNNTAGKYRGVNARGVHVITVAARISPKMASQTIWHELTHAMQSERDENFRSNYGKSVRSVGYMKSPYEREAKANEENHNTKFSLTLSNNRTCLPVSKSANTLVTHAVNGNVYYSTRYYRYMRNNELAISAAKASLGR